MLSVSFKSIYFCQITKHSVSNLWWMVFAVGKIQLSAKIGVMSWTQGSATKLVMCLAFLWSLNGFYCHWICRSVLKRKRNS